MTQKPRREGHVLSTHATQALRSGRVDEAKALARRALDVAPNDPEVLRAASEIAWALGDAPATAMLIERAIAHKMNRRRLRGSSFLARAPAREGKTDDAVSAYRKALASTPDNVNGWRELALALQSLRDVPGTIAAWQRVVSLRTRRLGSPRTISAARCWSAATGKVPKPRSRPPGSRLPTKQS